jgi:tetratricopeptide (TPR) repeat protein
VHSTDWTAVCSATEDALERAIARATMNERFEQTSAMATRAPAEILHYGSGWGALENRRREAADQPPMSSAATPFPAETLGPEQAPWLALLEHGKLPARQVDEAPCSPLVQPQWRQLLEHSAAQNPHWLVWYHLAVMRFRAGDADGARAAWEQSLAAEPNRWAQRDLAMLARDKGDHQAAAALWLTASAMAPDFGPLAIECCQALLRAERHPDLMRFVATLPPAVRALGRVRMLNAFAALNCGDLDTVARYFEGEVDIANIREKETSLSDLWFGWHEQRLAGERGIEVNEELRRLVRSEFPPPMRFDFRLRSE